MSHPSEDAALRQAAATAAAKELGVDVTELLAYAAGRLDVAAAEALEARLVHDDEARALLAELGGASSAAPATSARRPTASRSGPRWRRALPFAAALTAIAATGLLIVRAPAPPDYRQPQFSGVIAADRSGTDVDAASLAFAPDGTLVMVMDPVVAVDGDALRAAVFFVDGIKLVRANARVELGATGTVRVRLPMATLPRRAGSIRIDVAVARAPLDALAGLDPAEARRRVAASWTTFDVHIQAQEPAP